MTDFSKDANWIWIEQDVNKVHQYGCFRRVFDVESSGSGRLLVSANWDFIAYHNGEEICRGQFPDYPDRKTFTEIEVSNLKPGRNVLSFLVYNPGEDFFAAMKGPAGLLVDFCAEDVTLASDSEWKCCPHPAFQARVMPKVTGQLGFTTCFDARKDEDWTALDYDDSQWSSAVVNPDFVTSLAPRPLPMIRSGERIETLFVKAGWFRRVNESGTFAEAVSSDQYTFVEKDEVIKDGVIKSVGDKYSGSVLIADFGSERVGFIEVELSAPAGTVIDISHGEHLEDNIVRASVGGRNFADRLVCREGRNLYQLPFRRMGGRYLQLNIANKTGDVKIDYVGIRAWDRDLPDCADFSCDSEDAAKLREVGLHTMRMCMHDHYEDCPWREQGLYAYDSRNQMLFGYYAWGNYDFVKASLDLLGKSFHPDGHLNLCVPTNRTIIIPIFSYIWITALYEYFLYSGDRDFLAGYAEEIKGIVDCALFLNDEESGLCTVPDREKYWNFYEWVPGLDGGIHGGDASGRPGANEVSATHNLYVYEMLSSYEKISNALGNASEAERIASVRKGFGAAIEKYFWSEADGCYLTRSEGNFRLHEHVQYLMLTLDLVPTDKKQKVLESMKSGKLAEVTFSPLLYFMNGLFAQAADERALAAAKIDDAYLKMLQSGATTFWETEDGAAAFDNAGSLCHAWSSIHVYYYGAMVLGVRPLEPGFRKFEVKPYAGNFKFAKGSVPTPHGPIHVEWKRKKDNSLSLKVKHPEGLTAEISSYEEFPVTESEVIC